MNYSITAIVFAAALTVGIAHAATPKADPQDDPRVAFISNDPATRHAKIVAAAEQVCKTAIARDNFGDYSPLSDCVEAAINSARIHELKTVATN